MKLIDLLVQELPKRGGWPEGAEAVVQDADDMAFYFYTGGPVVNTGKSWWFKDSVDGSTWIFYEGKFEVADDHDTTTITRDQYQSVLAASQKVEWDGVGLPTVGCEVEYIPGMLGPASSDDNKPIEPTIIKIVAHEKYPNGGNDVVVGVWMAKSGGMRSSVFSPRCLVNIRSEADNKRHSAIAKITDAICGEIPDTGMATAANYAARAYDAIAAGKIPGVKLED